MTQVTIDEKPYEVDELSDECKSQLGALHYVDGEIQRLQAQLAAMKTARNTYALALRDSLPEK